MSFPGVTRRAMIGIFRALFVPQRVPIIGDGQVERIIPEAVCSSLVALKALDVRRRTVSLVGVPGVPDGSVNWIAGDHGATPTDQLNRNVFSSGGVPLSAGAWVRQSSDSVSFLQTGIGARLRSVEDKAREIVSVLDFGAKGDGVTDDTSAYNAAVATGKAVSVPYTAAGYAVSGIKVIDNMQIVGEKSGMALAPALIVNTSNTAAFHNSAGDNVFHCVFENLSCRAAPGVTGASFYAQTTRTKYSAYFTFRQIESYLNLRTSYVGLFIFTVWDRCRDGYLGTASDSEHGAILALAASYGQANQQNVNRIRDSMFFGAFGGAGAIVASFGVLWTFENTNFEALRTRAFVAHNILQARFSNCWFESVSAPSIVDLRAYPGTGAGSTATFDHCHFALTGSATRVLTVDASSTVSLRGNFFNVVGAGVRLCDVGARITVNEDNLAIAGAGASGFFIGTHDDRYREGRRTINGAVDNMVAGITFQNEGGMAATNGFMSQADIRVGSSFVTVATSHTGLGGTCIVSGYDPKGGAQMRAIKDWQGVTLRDITETLNATGKTVAFRVSGHNLQMKVDTGSLTVFTTMLH